MVLAVLCMYCESLIAAVAGDQVRIGPRTMGNAVVVIDSRKTVRWSELPQALAPQLSPARGAPLDHLESKLPTDGPAWRRARRPVGTKYFSSA